LIYPTDVRRLHVANDDGSDTMLTTEPARKVVK